MDCEWLARRLRPARTWLSGRPQGGGGLRHRPLDRAAQPAARAVAAFTTPAVRRAGRPCSGSIDLEGLTVTVWCSGRVAGRSALRQGAEIRSRGALSLLPGRTARCSHAPLGALRRFRLDVPPPASATLPSWVVEREQAATAVLVTTVRAPSAWGTLGSSTAACWNKLTTWATAPAAIAPR